MVARRTCHVTAGALWTSSAPIVSSRLPSGETRTTPTTKIVCLVVAMTEALWGCFQTSLVTCSC
jgi:hypothetical protein